VIPNATIVWELSFSTIISLDVSSSLGWIRLNSDGATKNGGIIAGFKKVLRDSKDIWICGFGKPLGSSSAFMTKS